MNLLTKIAIGVMVIVGACGCEIAATSANVMVTDAGSSAETNNQSAFVALHGVGLPKAATDATKNAEWQDADNDHYNVEVDCNDQNPDVHPGAFEFCDYVDNNCNGAVDENWKTVFDGAYGQPCSSRGVNGCWSEGIWACDFTHKWLSCNASPRTPTLEVCDGVDNDCNGVIDTDEWPDLGMQCETEEDGCTRVGVWVCDSYTKNSYCTAETKPTADTPDNCPPTASQ